MDWIDAPLNTVSRIFECHQDNAWKEEVFKFFNEKLMDNEILLKIPSVNDSPLHHLKNNSLVRFRCMIQDMFDPEFYLEVYEAKNLETNEKKLACGLFRDTISDNKIEINFDPNENETQDRLIFYCIPPPVENAWVKEGYAKQNCSGRHNADILISCNNQKRPLEDEERNVPLEKTSAAHPMRSNCVLNADGTGMNSSPKRAKLASDGVAEGVGGGDMLKLNLPVPDPNAVACIVKVYDRSDAYSLNDLVEFVGIFSMDSQPGNFSEGRHDSQDFTSELNIIDSMEFEEEAIARSPPSSFIPRLHVIKGFKLRHDNPYLPINILSEARKHDVNEFVSECREARNHLHSVITQMLWGDSLAADYIVCHLISTVYIRKDVTALGKFSVNLTHIPKEEEFPRTFYELISLLTSKSYFLPMTISKLNEGRFVPFKDYKTNCLQSGLLQLSHQTHLVVDETVLTPGQLDSKGVKNVTALGNLITWQKVEYDFNFHHLEFPADVPVLILSEGKSLLPADFILPIEMKCSQNTTHTFSAIKEYLTPSLLQKIRCYISFLKTMDYSMSDDLQKVVQDHFVEQRQIDVNNMKIDDLHNLLIIARLLSLSYGEVNLAESTWEKAKEMECQRKARLQREVRVYAVSWSF